MNLSWSRLVAAGILVVGIGCGDDEETTEAPEPAAAQPAAEAPAAEPQAEPQQAAQPAGGELESNFGTVTLEPNFMPDPKVVQGTSGGSVDASTLNASCAGWVSETPDHILQTSSAFDHLRILAFSDQDITLVVQKPDGTYACNDDFEATDPGVVGNMPAGTFKIWVGSYEQGQSAQYKLGFSELEATQPSSL